MSNMMNSAALSAADEQILDRFLAYYKTLKMPSPTDNALLMALDRIFNPKGDESDTPRKNAVMVAAITPGKPIELIPINDAADHFSGFDKDDSWCYINDDGLMVSYSPAEVIYGNGFNYGYGHMIGCVFNSDRCDYDTLTAADIRLLDDFLKRRTICFGDSGSRTLAIIDVTEEEGDDET